MKTIKVAIMKKEIKDRRYFAEDRYPIPYDGHWVLKYRKVIRVQDEMFNRVLKADQETGGNAYDMFDKAECMHLTVVTAEIMVSRHEDWNYDRFRWSKKLEEFLTLHRLRYEIHLEDHLVRIRK